MLHAIGSHFHYLVIAVGVAFAAVMLTVSIEQALDERRHR